MKRLALLLLLWVPSLAFAQVNIEEIRGDAKQGFTGKTDLGFEFQSGNTETISYAVSSRVDYGSGVHHYFLQLATERSETPQALVKDNAFAHLRWTAMWWGSVGTDFFAQSQYDSFKDLVLRQLEGGYVRVVVPIISGQVALGLGGMSEFEMLKGGKGEGFTARMTNYISLSEVLADKKLKIDLTTYYQPKFKDFSDYRLTLVSQVDFAIVGKLSFLPSFSYSYDSNPPSGVRVDDSMVKTSLRYSW